MAGLNKVSLIGNVGNDPEMRAFPDGTTVMNLSLATSESWKDTQGVKQERTEWHKLVMTGKLADALSPFIQKGSKLYAEGKLATRKWKDQNGQDRYTTEIRVREVQLLDSRPSDGQPYPAQQTQYQNSPQTQSQRDQNNHREQQQSFHRQQNSYEQARGGNYNPPAPSPTGGFDDFDQDIPF